MCPETLLKCLGSCIASIYIEQTTAYRVVNLCYRRFLQTLFENWSFKAIRYPCLKLWDRGVTDGSVILLIKGVVVLLKLCYEEGIVHCISPGSLYTTLNPVQDAGEYLRPGWHTDFPVLIAVTKQSKTGNRLVYPMSHVFAC